MFTWVKGFGGEGFVHQILIIRQAADDGMLLDELELLLLGLLPFDQLANRP